MERDELLKLRADLMKYQRLWWDRMPHAVRLGSKQDLLQIRANIGMVEAVLCLLDSEVRVNS